MKTRPVDSGRRKWLRGLVPSAAKLAQQAVDERVARYLSRQRRPPGAVGEAEFLLRCTRCGKCSQACPHGAIFEYAADGGIVARTPVMAPDLRACQMCEGFPCAQACPEGALNPPRATTVDLGVVHIATERCIAFAGPECGACVGMCPAGLSAITLRRWRPVLDEQECIGCGLCIAACPTSPPAIVLRPLQPDGVA